MMGAGVSVQSSFMATRELFVSRRWAIAVGRSHDCANIRRPAGGGFSMGPTLVGMERDRVDLVREAYSAAARDPSGQHPFAVGRELALGVGYPAEVLDRLPEPAVAAFAGV